MKINKFYKQKFNNAFPILSVTNLPYIWIFDNFSDNSEFKKSIDNFYVRYIDYLDEITKFKFDFVMPQSLIIISDFISLEKKLFLSYDNFFKLLANTLNYQIPSDKSIDDLENELMKRIEKFSQIKDLETLKLEYPFFYKNIYLFYIESVRVIADNKDVIDPYRKMNRKERRKRGLRDSRVLNELNYLENFSKYIYDYSLFFKRLLDNKEKIQIFLSKNEIITNLNSEYEYKKLDLMITISMFYNYLFSDKDEKRLLYVKDYFERNKNENDDTLSCKIKDVFPKGKGKYYTITPKNLYLAYKMFTKDKDYLNEIAVNENFSNMNRNQIVEYVDSLLNDLKNNFKKISLEDVQKKLKQIMENSDKTEVSKQKLESLIRKIDFLLNHRPISIIKGEETFNNYFGYIYSNGYVVLDYISSDVERSYGHALYVIHISDLKKYSKLSLSELRKNHSDKIIPIVHSSKWEEKLESILNSNIDSTTLTVSNEMDQIDMATTLSELEYLKNNLAVVNEEVEKRLKEKEVKIRKIKQYDEEIKQTPVKENLSDDDKEDLLEAEIDLLANSNNSSDFVSLHEIASEKKYKVKRNPDVSLKTKLRTLDGNGAFHCDFCDSPSFALDLYDAHHIIPISRGGIDNVYNTTCLCPSCHRKFHSKIPPTFAERGILLQRVRERILESTPEYLPNFDALFNPNYHNDVGLSESDLIEKYKREEEYYETNKEEEDQKFFIDWNTPKKL